jgi:3-deoxy-manno-octulosonate cytidylyltransferase (CMP-KDO synthetase)
VDFSVIIPARYGSTRLPGKPLAEIAGKPMIVHVADRAAASGAREVLVATDHAGIASAVREHGYTAVMTSRRHRSGTDRIAEVVARRRYPARRIVVNVQGDEPLIAPGLIREVAALLVRARGAGMATACTPIRDVRELLNPNVVKVVLDNAGDALYFSRAPIPYARDGMAGRRSTAVVRGLPAYRHLGLYAYRCDFLRRYTRLAPAAIERFESLEQLRALAHGYRIKVAITREAAHPGIDTPEDLERMRRGLHAAKRFLGRAKPAILSPP